MRLHDAIRERRTIHRYAAGPLPEGALQRAIEAAVYAPNHHLTEPWRFLVAGSATRQALLELGLELSGARAINPGSPARAQLEATLVNPAELIIIVQQLHPDPEVEREDYAAIACAILIMSLSLWADGIGSKWMTGGITTHPSVYRQLGLAPERERIVGFFWAGLAARARVPIPRRRKGVAELVRRLP